MRFKLRFVSLILLGVLVGALAVGCGGDSSSDSSSTVAKKGNDGGKASNTSQEGKKASKPLNKEELNLQMNEICIQVPPTYEETLKEAEKKNGGKLTKAETTLQGAVPPLVTAMESMEGLTPSPAEAQDLEETIEALDAGIKGLEEEPKSKLSGPESPLAEFQEKAKQFKYESCEGL